MSMTLHSVETRDPAACESFLRISDVLARVGVSRSTWLYWVKVGFAPKPVRLGPSGHLVAWLESEMRAWMEEQKNRSRPVEPKRHPFCRPVSAGLGNDRSGELRDAVQPADLDVRGLCVERN